MKGTGRVICCDFPELRTMEERDFAEVDPAALLCVPAVLFLDEVAPLLPGFIDNLFANARLIFERCHVRRDRAPALCLLEPCCTLAAILSDGRAGVRDGLARILTEIAPDLRGQ